MNFIIMILQGDHSYEILKYVTGVPFFWISMGLTTATAMFVGATMYNGDLKKMAKGLVAVLSYGGFLFLATSTRIFHISKTIGIKDSVQAHAGMVTWMFVTAFYVLGIILGVTVSRQIRGKHEVLNNKG